MENKVQELEKTVELLKKEIARLREEMNGLLNDRERAKVFYHKVRKNPFFSRLF
jgi:uncharacterized small protein (DUF1192 family)